MLVSCGLLDNAHYVFDLIANFHLGMQAHGWLLKLGACTDVVLSSSLISFYGKFKRLEDANAVFNHASRHNNMIWSAKIVGGCREKQFFEVLCDFKEMGRQGVKKDSFTFSNVLKACGKMLNREQCGEQVSMLMPSNLGWSQINMLSVV
ncbi:hypothetical protein AHAS_Ahas06G0226800 [Arachis hypogaea]